MTQFGIGYDSSTCYENQPRRQAIPDNWSRLDPEAKRSTTAWASALMPLFVVFGATGRALTREHRVAAPVAERDDAGVIYAVPGPCRTDQRRCHQQLAPALALGARPTTTATVHTDPTKEEVDASCQYTTSE